MLAVQLTAIAEKEIDDAEVWYESQSFGLGHAFHDEIDQKIARIAENPLLYPVVLYDIRKAVTGRFPFNILFRVQDKTIVIIGCFHAKRNPKSWRKR